MRTQIEHKSNGIKNSNETGTIRERWNNMICNLKIFSASVAEIYFKLIFIAIAFLNTATTGDFILSLKRQKLHEQNSSE
jgi:hypothetical protein